MKSKQPFCLMPFLHFHVGNHGKVKACCVANIPFGNIKEQSLEEIWQGKPIQNLREKFQQGEADKRCAQCLNREKAGGKSIRQETFERFPDFVVKEKEVDLPIYFDIRFSNVCNFRCRTCWHGASSKWFADAKQLGRNFGKKAIIKNVTDLKDFINKTGDALLQAEEIYFAGGEPLVTEEHYFLLDWLIENGATQMRLRYNTNFSVLKFKTWEVMELWQHFPKVELMASIDATEKLGEYIRKEMNWQTVLKNRGAIRSLAYLRFKIAPTVSVLNMAHLPRLYQQSLELNLIEPNDFYINLLERPYYYNIQAFPSAQKEKITNDFKAFLEPNNLLPSIKLLFQECLDFMWSEDKSNYWEQFLSETAQLDEIRKEKRSDLNVIP